jgi:acetyltransferase-like isoleucine patch superfamily enzyme
VSSLAHSLAFPAAGTGKGDGDRHPKISDNVLIGAAATVLGNIRIGKNAMVAAGSLVLKPVPRNTMVAGSPAKEIGCMTGRNFIRCRFPWLCLSSQSQRGDVGGSKNL